MKRGSNEMEFWKTFLSGTTEKIDLFCTNKHNLQNYLSLAKIGKYSFEIESSATIQQIQFLSKSQQVNLSTTLLSLFSVSLFQCTGKEDFIVCTPLFATNNIFPLRMRMDEIQTLDELFQAITKVISNCSFNQDVSFKDIINNLNIDQNQKSSIGQILFVFTSEQENLALQRGNFIKYFSI